MNVKPNESNADAPEYIAVRVEGSVDSRLVVIDRVNIDPHIEERADAAKEALAPVLTVPGTYLYVRVGTVSLDVPRDREFFDIAP